MNFGWKSRARWIQPGSSFPTGFLTNLWEEEGKFEHSKATERKLQKHLLSKQSNDSVATYGDMAFSPTKRAKFPPRTGNNSWMLQKATKLWSRDWSVARALDWTSKGPWFYPGSRKLELLSDNFFLAKVQKTESWHFRRKWKESSPASVFPSS